jgi:hypothetical protein
MDRWYFQFQGQLSYILDILGTNKDWRVSFMDTILVFDQEDPESEVTGDVTMRGWKDIYQMLQAIDARNKYIHGVIIELCCAVNKDGISTFSCIGTNKTKLITVNIDEKKRDQNLIESLNEIERIIRNLR